MSSRLTWLLMAFAMLALGAAGASITGGIYGTPTPPAGGTTPTFESNWDNACTGSGDTCLEDGGVWDFNEFNADGSLHVELGTATDTGTSITGSYVLALDTNGEDGGWVAENTMFDLTKDNQYMRWYVQYRCAWDSFASPPGVEGANIIHGVQGIPITSNFYGKDYASGDFPGATAAIAYSFSFDGVTDTVGSNFVVTNDGSYAEMGWGVNGAVNEGFTQPCGEWIRKEVWIECPSDEPACLNVTAGVDVSVRFHIKDTIITGTDAGSVYDDTDYIVRNYDGNATPVTFDYFYNTENGGMAMNGGFVDFSIGVSGQSTTAAGFDTLKWTDGFAYGASDTDGAWIGAHADE